MDICQYMLYKLYKAHIFSIWNYDHEIKHLYV